MNLGEIRTKRNTEGRRNFLPFFSDVMGPERSTNRFGVIFIAATFSFISSHIWMGWGRGGASFRSGGLRFYLVLPSFTLCFRFSNFYLRNRKKNEFFSFFFLAELAKRGTRQRRVSEIDGGVGGVVGAVPRRRRRRAGVAAVPSVATPLRGHPQQTGALSHGQYLLSDHYRVFFLPSFTGFYRVLLGFTGFYWVLLGFTGFC